MLTPAIEAAETGVPVSFKQQLEVGEELERIRAYPETAAVLLPNGNLPAMAGQEGGGDRLDTGALAKLLKQILKRGKRAFQQGAMAKHIGDFVRGNGGILSPEDLAAYKPRVLRERPGRYRDHNYISCFDQVAYETLNILAHYNLRDLGADSYAYRH